MSETDEQKERRLVHDAAHVCIGRLVHPDIPAKTGYTVKVEVTYQQDEESAEQAGYFTVMLPVDVGPWEDDPDVLDAHDIATAELERRYPEAAYTSVDDIRSY
jgi:hypothetical protein